MSRSNLFREQKRVVLVGVNFGRDSVGQTTHLLVDEVFLQWLLLFLRQPHLHLHTTHFITTHNHKRRLCCLVRAEMGDTLYIGFLKMCHLFCEILPLSRKTIDNKHSCLKWNKAGTKLFHKTVPATSNAIRQRTAAQTESILSRYITLSLTVEVTNVGGVNIQDGNPAMLPIMVLGRGLPPSQVA